MLSHPDAALAARDQALPGLALVLDPDALLAALQNALPGVRIEAARSTYVRYKPGMNCLVAYDLEVAGWTITAYAKAYGPDAEIKLNNAREKASVPSLLGPGRVVLDEPQVVVSVLPNDSKLKQLRHLFDTDERPELLSVLLADRRRFRYGALHTLRYKPERRWVGQLVVGGKPRAVVRAYAEGEYATAARNAAIFSSSDELRVPRYLGASDQGQMIVLEWLDGQPLDAIIATPDAQAAVTAAGAALRKLHHQTPHDLSQRTRAQEAAELHALAANVATLCPELRAGVEALAQQCAEWLTEQPALHVATHGDFYSDQVLVTGDGVALLDFDRAAYADPVADLGLFIAHLEREALLGTLPVEYVPRLRAALLDGYAADATQYARVDMYVAIGLLHLAPDPFRRREPDWNRRIAAVIEQAQAFAHAQARVAG